MLEVSNSNRAPRPCTSSCSRARRSRYSRSRGKSTRSSQSTPMIPGAAVVATGNSFMIIPPLTCTDHGCKRLNHPRRSLVRKTLPARNTSCSPGHSGCILCPNRHISSRCRTQTLALHSFPPWVGVVTGDPTVSRYRRVSMASGGAVVVIGGSSGIGEAIAKHYADAGRKVYVSSRDQSRADETAERIGGDIHGIAVDLAQPHGIAAGLKPIEG